MISVVMCSRTQADADAATRMVYAKALAGVPHEIVNIINPRSMCAGYNEGVARARGDVLIFSHDDVEILGDDFAARLLSHLQHADIVGVAGTDVLVGPLLFAAGKRLHAFGQIAHGIRRTGEIAVDVYRVPARRIVGVQALDGVMIAARRAVCDRVRFDESIPGFHLYDLDFSYCAFRAGFKLAVACDLHLAHWSRDGSSSYESPEWSAAAEVFLNKHGANFPVPPHATAVASVEQALEVMRANLPAPSPGSPQRSP